MKIKFVVCVAVIVVCATSWTWNVLADQPEFRMWSDASGRVKIRAKFGSLKGGIVTLQKEDGSEIQIPLKKLSAADQKAIQKPAEPGENPFETKSENPFETKSENPFETKVEKKSDNPFETGTKKSSSSGKSGKISSKAGRRGSGRRAAKTDSAESGVVDSVNAPIASGKPLKLPFPNGAAWKIPVPAPPSDAEFSFEPKSAAIPGKEFFEKIERMVVNVRAQKLVLGYVNHSPSRDSGGQTRIVFIDLKTGTAESGEAIPGVFNLLALSDDAKMMLVHKSAGWGHDTTHTSELWRLEGNNVTSRLSWNPFEGEKSWGAGEIAWGAFAGPDKLIMASKGGIIGVWKTDGPEPLYYTFSTQGAIPALSPDQKLLAFCGGDRLDVLDIEKKKIVASAGLGMKLTSPMLAFSPSGKQICCVAHGRIIMGQTATGKLLGNIETELAGYHPTMAVPSDDHVIVKNEYLFKVPEKLELWKYDGHDHICCAGGWSFLAINERHDKKQGSVIAMKIPHAGIKDLLDRAEKDPSVFVLREGTTVKLDLSGLANTADRAKITADLTANLQKNKFKVGDDGTVILTAATSTPKEKEVAYRRAGEYKFQEFFYSLKFLHNGSTIWNHSRPNTPSVVSQGPNQTFEMALREFEKVDSTWFGKVTLPKQLQDKAKLTSGTWGKQVEGFGFGQTDVSTTGIK